MVKGVVRPSSHFLRLAYEDKLVYYCTAYSLKYCVRRDIIHHLVLPLSCDQFVAVVVSSAFRVCYHSHKCKACLYQKGWAFMPTQEERLTVVEQGPAAVQGDFLIHLSENNRQMAALNKVISIQELHNFLDKMKRLD